MFTYIASVRLANKYLHKGDEYYQNHEYQKAISNYRFSLYFISSAEAHYKIAVVYKEQDKLIEAVGECSTALKIDPENGEMLNFLGDCFYSLGLYESALEIFSTASLCESNIKRSFSFYMMGKILKESGMWLKAMNSYKKAFELDPKLVDAKKEIEELEFVLN